MKVGTTVITFVKHL